MASSSESAPRHQGRPQSALAAPFRGAHVQRRYVLPSGTPQHRFKSQGALLTFAEAFVAHITPTKPWCHGPSCMMRICVDCSHMPRTLWVHISASCAWSGPHAHPGSAGGHTHVGTINSAALRPGGGRLWSTVVFGRLPASHARRRHLGQLGGWRTAGAQSLTCLLAMAPSACRSEQRQSAQTACSSTDAG